MIGGMCHCGAVAWQFHGEPPSLTRCNCSICRRIGGLWAYGALANVSVIAAPGATIAYTQGDRTLAFHTCRVCGCTTHWLSLLGEGDARRVAVNMRMAEPEAVASIPIRDFDGADSWTYPAET